MVSRTIVYLLVMSLLHLCWIIEQPASSLMEKHPLFVWLCSHFKIHRVPWIKGVWAEQTD